MSWGDANANDESADISTRLTEFEQTINAQLSELRTEVGLAAAAMRSGGAPGGAAPLGDLEGQLARAVTVSLSAALEAIRESLTDAVTDALARLALRVEDQLASLPLQTQPAQPPRPQWSQGALDEVAASLQHSVLLALSSFEQSQAASPAQPVDPIDAPATVADVAQVTQRMDETSSLLVVVAEAVAHLGSRVETMIAAQPKPATPPRPEWNAAALDEVAASLQDSVLLALSSFEQASLAPSGMEPIDAPATVRDVARVNQRIDELRSLLLG